MSLGKSNVKLLINLCMSKNLLSLKIHDVQKPRLIVDSPRLYKANDDPKCTKDRCCRRVMWSSVLTLSKFLIRCRRKRSVRRCGTKTDEERHRAAHSRMDRITASGRHHQQHVPRPCYSPSMLHETRSLKPDVGPEVFRMLPVRRYRYYLTHVWLNWLRSVTFDCLE